MKVGNYTFDINFCILKFKSVIDKERGKIKIAM